MPHRPAPSAPPRGCRTACKVAGTLRVPSAHPRNKCPITSEKSYPKARLRHTECACYFASRYSRPAPQRTSAHHFSAVAWARPWASRPCHDSSAPSRITAHHFSRSPPVAPHRASLFPRGTDSLPVLIPQQNHGRTAHTTIRAHHRASLRTTFGGRRPSAPHRASFFGARRPIPPPFRRCFGGTAMDRADSTRCTAVAIASAGRVRSRLGFATRASRATSASMQHMPQIIRHG